MGTGEEGDAFFEARWPQVPTIADSQAHFYEAISLERVSIFKLLRPRAWGEMMRALFKGAGGGLPVGDPMRMSGVLIVRGSQVLSRHEYKSAGNHPRWAEWLSAHGIDEQSEKAGVVG